MITYWINKAEIKGRTFIPKYYNPEIKNELSQLERNGYRLVSIGDLVAEGTLTLTTGHEIGKMAYGTGDIPFVRTSDISNWEIKTLPKQGVSEEIYAEYSKKQDIKTGDILFVRDGTYLIGTNCIVTRLDKKILFQSHVLKIRTEDPETLNPYMLFLLVNSPIVQRQIRSVQFTADTIDTIGGRINEIILPIPTNSDNTSSFIEETKKHLTERESGKAFIKELPYLMEEALLKGSPESFDNFYQKTWGDIINDLSTDTVSSEFGGFKAFPIDKNRIKNRIYLPKYYDPEIDKELSLIGRNCSTYTIGQLVERGLLSLATGDEIGKMAYGTGSIPFIRTSDFSNWEIKHDPKHGVSEEIYNQYKEKQDITPGDILIVRDGTYLIGTSCLITDDEQDCLYCGGLIKIRTLDTKTLDPYLLIGLLNSFIVKRQIRTKQFTRDVIDTLGKRLEEVVLPIPNEPTLRNNISNRILHVLSARIKARDKIKKLSEKIHEQHTCSATLSPKKIERAAT